MAKSFQFDLINAYSNNRSIYTEQIATDNTLAQTLRLEIKNISGNSINFDPLSGDPGKGNYHFALFFRGGIVSRNTALNGIIKSGSDCKMSKAVAGGFSGSYFFYFICNKPALAQGAILSLELQKFMAKDRNSDIETEPSLNFQNLSDSGGKPLVTSAKSDLTVKNSLVNRPLPFQFSFRDHNTVLNDGSSNDLSLSVQNMAVPEDESLQTNGDIVFNESSSISIGFDVQLKSETKNWALGTDNNIKACGVTLPSGWAEKDPSTVDDAGKIFWTFGPADPEKPITIGSLQEMIVMVTGIKTNLPAGFTNLYFSYQNVPRYGNGEFRVPILKTPLVTRGKQVGIGKNPAATLDVGGQGTEQVELHIHGRILSSGSAPGIDLGDKNHFIALNGDNVSIYNNGWGLDLDPNGKVRVNKDLEVQRDQKVIGNVTVLGNAGIGSEPNDFLMNLAFNEAGTLQIASDLDLSPEQDSRPDFIKFGKNSQFNIGFIKSGHYKRRVLALDCDLDGALGFYSNNSNALLEVDGDTGNTYIKGNLDAASVSIRDNLEALGGVDIPNKALSFGNRRGQLINLYDSSNGIGIQNYMLYLRTGDSSSFAFYQGGSHSEETWNPGKGGKLQMAIDGNGNVGIGAKPSGSNAKLEVYGTGTQNYMEGAQFLARGYGEGYSDRANLPLSIYADNWICGEGCLGFSDARIKRVTGRSDAGQDLATLLQLKITDYTKVDTVENGTGAYKKLIAQEVKEVFPQAVSQTSGVVPDIYEPARMEDGWIQLATDLKAGEQLRIITSDKTQLLEVLEAEPNRFRVSDALVDEHVFVYGRQVDDFHLIDYEAIAMLNVSATQELYRQMEALRAAQERMQRQLEGFALQTVAAEA